MIVTTATTITINILMIALKIDKVFYGTVYWKDEKEDEKYLTGRSLRVFHLILIKTFF